MTRILLSTFSLLLLSATPALSHAQEAPSIWDGIYSAEQASRGEAVYREACLSCHGQDLGGNSNSPGLVGMGFMFLWEGRSVGEFYEKIRSEMPTDRPGRLSDKDYVDVVSYILQKNGFPSGDSTMQPDVSRLDSVEIAPQ